jgi:hypothetical protein
MSYIGNVTELPLGTNGLTGTKNLYNAHPLSLIQATNITYESGTLQKEGGASKYNDTAITGGPQVSAGWDWWPSDGVQRMVVFTSTGLLLKDSGDGSFPTTLKSGLPTDQSAVFVEAGKEVAASNRKLVIFIPTSRPQVLAADGTTTANLTTPPADWSGTNQPTFGTAHEGRLWAGGNPNDPHRLYYSTVGNHEDFTGSGAGSISVFPGEGEKLIGALSFKGLLIAWKFPHGIYALDTSSPTLGEWRVARLSNIIGGVSPRAQVLIDDDILFLDATGAFQLLSGIDEFGNVGSRNLSQVADLMPFVRENVNLGNLALTQAVYYTAKREAHFAVPGTGSSFCNRRLVVDFNRLDTVRFRWSDRDNNVSLWLRKDEDNTPRMVAGDDAGFVWELDQETRTQDDAGYTAVFQTAHTDFSYLDPKLATIRKLGQFLELITEPEGNWNVTVKIIWDGQVRQILTYNMGSIGAGLGSFTLDTDALASAQIQSVKHRIVGSGRRFSIEVSNDGAGEDFSISRAFLHWVPGDER